MSVVNKFNVNNTSVILDTDIYDVSAHNNGAVFKSLSDLLNNANLSTLIPVSVRKGGMTIRFIQNSDNKYIQARCMAQNFTTDVTQWQGVDDEPTAGSENLVKSGGVELVSGFRKADNLEYRLELYLEDSLIGTSGQILTPHSGHNVYKLSGSIVKLKRKIVLYGLREGGAGFFLANCFDSNGKYLGGIAYLGLDGVLVRGVNNILLNLSYGYDDISYILINVSGEQTPTILVSQFNNESQLSKVEETLSELETDMTDIKHLYTEFVDSGATISTKQLNATINFDGNIVSNQHTNGWTIYKVETPKFKYHSRVILRNIKIGGTGIGVVSAFDSNDNLIKVLTTYYNRSYTSEEFVSGEYQDIIVDLSDVFNVSYLLVCEQNPENKQIVCLIPKYRGENQTMSQVVLVDKNGGGNFTKIKDAVEYCLDRRNPCTILINPGEYDIIEEFGGESYTEGLETGHYYGMKLKNDIRIIGNGNRVVLKALYTGTNQPMTDNFSIFNAEGSFYIENLELIVENVRYCIHDDMPDGFNKNYRISYKNCKMAHLGTTSQTYTAVGPLGGGCRGNSVYEIDGCVFYAPEGTWGASYHNNWTSEKAKVIVRNCYFINCTFMLYCYAPTGSEIDFLINGNSFASDIKRVGSDPNNKLSLIAFNNEIKSS